MKLHSLLVYFKNCQKEGALFCASRNSVPGTVNSRLKNTYTILNKHVQNKKQTSLLLVQKHTMRSL